MSSSPQRFTSSEIKRAGKALREAGLEIKAVIFRKDGFEFQTAKEADKPAEDEWKVA